MLHQDILHSLIFSFNFDTFSDGAEVQSHALYNAALVGDVEAALLAILHGGDVTWANPEEGMSTSTHQVVEEDLCDNIQ